MDFEKFKRLPDEAKYEILSHSREEIHFLRKSIDTLLANVNNNQPTETEDNSKTIPTWTKKTCYLGLDLPKGKPT